MITMTGITISEMAEKLGIDKNAVLQRLFVAKIKPITREALYDISALKAISNVAGKGRPKKATAPEKPAKNKKAK
jgi:predicted ArsR family transcriptional regulator